MQSRSLPPARWNMPKKIGMLFLTAYLFFLFMDFIGLTGILPDKLGNAYDGMWNWLATWAGSHLLHLSHPIVIKHTGSGDSVYNYVMQLLWMVLALLIAVVWALADRKRPDYSRLYEWVRVFARYNFAFILFLYGFVKVIKLQFPFPSLARLAEPYGDSSPMGLAWSFIGYSKGYNLFTGGLEVLAGSLLLFRRTTLLGALMAMTVMINIAAMNLAYDIPVKLFSLNLVLLSAFLAAHDFTRIKNVFFLNAAAPPPLPDRRPKTRRSLLVQRILKVAIIIFLLYSTLWDSMQRSHKRGDLAPRPPLYGIYNVENFAKQGIALPPLATDTLRWKRMIVLPAERVRVTIMTDSIKPMGLKVDTVRKTMWFVPETAPADSFLLRYTEPDREHLLLSGLMGADSVRISMKRFNINKYRLVNRGFHWINEIPYNR